MNDLLRESQTAIVFMTHHLGVLGGGAMLALALVMVWVNSRKQQKARRVLQKAVETKTNEPISLHPEIDPGKCAGCGNCVTACPEGKILQLVDHRAVLVAPSYCVGHGECERSCPTGAISLVFGTKTRGMDIPRISSNYETNVPGLYIAGELGGMGLIRNAVKQGKLAVGHAAGTLKSKSKGPEQLDLLIVGSGPAGVSAMLAAHEAGLNYLCIEQGSFGGTVYQFPRQKIVMSYPLELPVVGKLKFAHNRVSKEELLEQWNSARQQFSLKVQENTKFTGLEKKGDSFEVQTSKGPMHARKVLLSMGVRGSPRKLGVKGEELSKVTYNLVDPEQYQNFDVIVVGGGNAGVEAAVSLAKKSLRNRVTLLVRGKVFDRCNEANQNEAFAVEKQGLLKIVYESQILSISKDTVDVQTLEGPKTIKNDFVLIFAGAEMPHQFLMSLGIQIEKKFGEILRK